VQKELEKRKSELIALPSVMSLPKIPKLSKNKSMMSVYSTDRQSGGQDKVHISSTTTSEK
jgi:hypothetical protein